MPLFVAFPEAGAVSKRCLGSCQSAPEHVRPRLKAKSSKTLQSGTSGYTVVLVHQAVRLSEVCTPGQIVALVGHSPAACEELKAMVNQLRPRHAERIEVIDMIAIGRDGRPRYGDVVAPDPGRGVYLRRKDHEVKALLTRAVVWCPRRCGPKPGNGPRPQP
jgi:hypothetical protein